MKKLCVLVLTLILISFSTAVFAAKQQWVDKNYDFSKVHRILVLFNCDDVRNGISDRELMEIFPKQIKDMFKGYKPGNYSVTGIEDVMEEINSANNINMEELYNEDSAKASGIFGEYVKANFDLVAFVYVLTYGVGNGYREGYYTTVPSTTYSSTFDINTGTYYNTTNIGTTQQYIPGGKTTVSYVKVRFIINKLPEAEPVWNRIDDREESGTSPKSLYGHIFKSWTNELAKKMKLEYKKFDE